MNTPQGSPKPEPGFIIVYWDNRLDRKLRSVRFTTKREADEFVAGFQSENTNVAVRANWGYAKIVEIELVKK
jgi:hypothetical protein